MNQSNNLDKPSEVIQIDKAIKTFIDLFHIVKNNSASDLHLQVGSPPLLRINGILRRINHPPLTNETIEHFASELLPEEKLSLLKSKGDLDFAYGVEGEGRLRMNFYYQKGFLNIACRMIHTSIPSFETLHLPVRSFEKIAKLTAGLVVLAGSTGTGKSTSLASIIDYINKNRRCHILTIEDPIEYLHLNNQSYISQREVGIDVESFPVALKYAFRQDPDVILIGEIRDSETAALALSAAETGHLVLTTLHSANVAKSIGRLIDFFPPDQHFQIRQNLQFNLQSIVCQNLIPSIHENLTRVPTTEIMFINATIRKLIQNGEDVKITQAIQQGQEELMQDFNLSLKTLVEEKLISKDTALNASSSPDALEMNLKGIYLDEDRAIF